uniref:Uncharacterized protein n=1 Tax=Acrobeloides nanus TaxID=290746 RepID=A0A914EGP9_9BILA
MTCPCTLAVLAAGWSALAYFSYKLLNALYNILYPFAIAAPKDLKKLAGGAKWAVVTGSTDGIGKSYAVELARRGFNIVLISRTQSKLDEVKQEILQKTPNVEVRTISFDFTNANLADYEEKIVKQLNGVDVGVLVNNVGMSFEYPDRFDKISGGTKSLTDITVINTVPVTVLTAEILKQMVPRNAGVIINLASAASYHQMRYWSIYSATKKFVTHLTHILSKEFDKTGIVFQVVCPMLVATKMSKAKAAFFSPGPEAFVKQALRSVGHVSETTGCLSHELQANVFALPGLLIDSVMDKGNLAIRNRALKKKEAKKE